MRNYFENRNEIQRALKRYSESGINRKLKCAAWIMIGLAATLLMLSLILLIGMEDFPYRWLLILRGTAGVCAIIFAILYAILIYRTNRRLWRERGKEKDRR